MTPNSVVKRFDVFEHVGARRIAGFIASPMHAFVLQTVEETLARRALSQQLPLRLIDASIP